MTSEAKKAWEKVSEALCKGGTREEKVIGAGIEMMQSEAIETVLKGAATKEIMGAYERWMAYAKSKDTDTHPIYCAFLSVNAAIISVFLAELAKAGCGQAAARLAMEDMTRNVLANMKEYDEKFSGSGGFFGDKAETKDVVLTPEQEEVVKDVQKEILKFVKGLD